MWVHIINVYPCELLLTKIKEFRINEYKKKKKKFKKMKILHFLPNNILTRLFKELKNIYKNNYQ